MNGEEKIDKYDSHGPRSSLAQVLAALGSVFFGINVGVIIGMPTIVIGALNRDGSEFRLSESETSWFGSLAYIIQPVCSLASGFFQDWLGRKTCLMLINIPELAAWVILYLSTSVVHVYISAGLLGLALGLMEAPALSYIGEISQPRFRGIFSSLLAIFFNCGIMFESVLGAVVHWRTMVLINALGPLLAISFMVKIPESPSWLVSKGKVKEAERAFQWLRGWVPPQYVATELNDIVKYVQKHRATAGSDTTTRGKLHQTWAVMKEPGTLSALRLILYSFVIANSVSLFGIKPYLIGILDELRLPITSNQVVAICGTLTVVGAVFLSAVVSFLGRRFLSLLSLGLCTFLCFGIAVYLTSGFYLPWIPIILFSLSNLFSQCGIYILPWILCTELFPLRARSFGSGFCAAFAYIFNFAQIKSYFLLAHWISVPGIFFLNGFIGALGFVFLYRNLPETEGVSLEEIEQKLRGEKPTTNGIDNKGLDLS